MASPTERRRNNLRVGMFVTFALIMAMVVIVLIGDIAQYFKGSPNSYVAYFSVSEGVKNLKGGSDVRVGGLRMGQVTHVEIASRPTDLPKTEGVAAEEIRVKFTLDSAIQLYEMPAIAVRGPLIGAESWLSISSFGDVSAAALAEGAEIDGRGVGSPLKDLIGIDVGNIGKDAETIIANFKRLSEDWAGFYERFDPRFEELMQQAKQVADNVEEATNSARSVVQKFEQDQWPGWSTRVDNMLASGEQASGRIDDFIIENEPRATEMMADARDAVKKFEELGESLNVTAEKVEAMADRLDETITNVNAMLDDGRDAVGLASDTLAGIKRDYPAWSQDIDETLANASLTAQQAKLAMIEIRDNPWKVLYTPSREEIENELLYDAARSFALAVADLKSASLAAERILNDHEDALRQDPATLERVKRNLIDPLERYEDAQAKLFEILKSK